MARFRNVSRLSKAGPHAVVGASGDMSDFQHIKHLLESVEIENIEADDGHALSPKAVHTFLTRVLYNRCVARGARLTNVTSPSAASPPGPVPAPAPVSCTSPRRPPHCLPPAGQR